MVVNHFKDEKDKAEVPLITSYTCSLQEEQIEQLRDCLAQRGFVFREVKYAHFGVSSKDISITLYQSGKLLIQGKGTADFVRYCLEPEILKEVRLGYEYLLDEESEDVERIGVDESGKGDYFGPLVVAGVYAGSENIKLLYDLKVKDSKTISDTRILKISKILCSKFTHSVVIIGPTKYNVLYDRMLNLNKMLAWGHARVIENLLSKVNCKHVILDKFGDKSLVKNALMRKGRRVELQQVVRGESDIVVAAASIVARAKFLQRMDKLNQEFGMEFPKGGGGKVIDAGRKFIEARGIQQLTKVAKLHFKNTQKILGVEQPAS